MSKTNSFKENRTEIQSLDFENTFKIFPNLKRM